MHNFPSDVGFTIIVVRSTRQVGVYVGWHHLVGDNVLNRYELSSSSIPYWGKMIMTVSVQRTTETCIKTAQNYLYEFSHAIFINIFPRQRFHSMQKQCWSNFFTAAQTAQVAQSIWIALAGKLGQQWSNTATGSHLHHISSWPRWPSRYTSTFSCPIASSSTCPDT